MHLCRRVGFRALSSSGIRLQSTSTDSSFLISVPEIKRGKRVDVNAKRVPRLSKRKARKLLDATKKIAERTEANSADIKKKLAKPQKKETSTESESLKYSRRVEGLVHPSETDTLTDLDAPFEMQPVAQLEHGLDRVLFNPGVHWQRDPRSRVYNFPPHLENIPNVLDFAFERLQGFVSSSRDNDLRQLAQREGKKFAGSTSSLSGILSQIYFLISGDKKVDISTLSKSFPSDHREFTPGQRMAPTVVYNFNDGVYAIDSYKHPNGRSIGDKNILVWMGTLLEKYLTMDPEQFSAYMRTETNASTSEETPQKEAYRYSKSNRFVMRSQLDCHDPRLPGTGVFDLKTRACLPIRMDLLNFEENSGYLIRSQYGEMESFEREYYDLIRSAFLKYSFQVRIGNMDGVMVAYHNTARMFGYQYIPLEEMEARLYGSTDRSTGDRVFDKCVKLMEIVSDEVVSCFPNQSVKAVFETLDGSNELKVWVEPLEWNETKGPRPIKQLVVSASSYLGVEHTTPSRAIDLSYDNWTVHWTVTHVIASEEGLRASLRETQDRAFREYSLPSGVGFGQIEHFWKNLNFGGEVDPSATETQEAIDLKNFRNADRRVQALRALARNGKVDSEKWEKMDRGKPKQVLGREVTPEEWALAQEEAKEADEAEKLLLAAQQAKAKEAAESGYAQFGEGLLPGTVRFDDAMPTTSTSSREEESLVQAFETYLGGSPDNVMISEGYDGQASAETSTLEQNTSTQIAQSSAELPTDPTLSRETVS